MKKRTISLILITIIILQFVLVSCNSNKDDNIDTENTTTVTPVDTTVSLPETIAPETKIPETTSSSVTDTETTTAAETTGTYVEDKVLMLCNTSLMYKEDFQSYDLTDDTATAIASLGWKIQSTADGAYANNSAEYSIVNHNGSKCLYVNNFKNGKAGNDSYVLILSSDQFGYLYKQNFTYQYDIEYTEASDAARYIAIVSGYSGGYYNTFHFRNSGYGNNECHNGSWASFGPSSGDYNAPSKDTKSEATIAYKLLGKKYNGTSLFNNVSVSIRYEVDWDNGNKIYMRVNDPKSYSQGKWVLISYADKNSDAFKNYWNRETGAPAIALKVGGGQCGYVDNIQIWWGTDCEPADTEPLVSSHTTGHFLISQPGGGDMVCLYCGRTKNQIENSWLLGDSIPMYTDGTPSDAIYATGQGFHDKKLAQKNESPMQIIRNTSSTAYDSYLKQLESAGFTNEYTFSDNSGKYNSYVNGNKRLYTYFTAATNEVRIIDDKVSECSPSDFGYTYTKKTGESTTLYQYGLPMNEQGVGINSNNEKKIDCGMMYIIKLADNSIFIIDGGGYQQFDKAERDGLMSFLEKITGVGKTEKIRIAGWFITHTHNDHFSGFCLFIKEYGNRFTLERVFCNLPSVYSSESLFSDSRNNYMKLLQYTEQYLGNNFKFIKIHTGEQFSLADVKFRVIYTHEDLVDARTAKSGINADFNNSSSVLRIEFDGKAFMMFGDINKPAMNKIINIVPAELLKCDIVQIAHHVINDLTPLYNICKSPVVFVPQSPGGASRYEARITMMNTVKKYVKNDMLFYASLGTYGVEVKNNDVVKVFEDKVYGGAYVTSWGW